MALLNNFFQNKKLNLNLGNKRVFPDTNKWVKPKFDAGQLRLVVFLENDIKGRTLLLDSNAIRKLDDSHKSCVITAPAVKFLHRAKLASHTADAKIPKYKAVKVGSDVKVLGEMMFGSVAMSYKGSAMKVHSIKTPPQLMLTKVFIPERNKTATCESDGGLDSCSLANSSCDLTSNRHILRNPPSTNLNIAQSIPVDVPMPSYSSVHDSGIASSLTSSGSYAPTFASSGSSSVSLSSSSLNSLHRRWRRNQTTSIEGYLRKRSSVEHGKAVATGAVHRRDKVGIGILFQAGGDRNDDRSRMFQNFFFSHITIFEGRIAKLQAAIERGFYHKTNSTHTVMQAFELFQQEVIDLYTTPRLSEPVWLNMVAYSNYRYVLCERFMRELMAFYKYETKATHFFLSSVITAVLTYHLAWVPTVTPAGGTPSRAYLEKHSAKWLNTLTKTHPYNPLWAQLGDVYGAIGHPQRLSRTIVVGKKADLVNKLLYILSYFIRCSEVHASVNGASSPSILSKLGSVDFDDATIFFDPPTPDVPPSETIDNGIDVTDVTVIANKRATKEPNSPSSVRVGESSSVASPSSSRVSSALSGGTMELQKMMRSLESLDITNDVLNIMRGNGVSAENDEVERLLRETVVKCGASQFYVRNDDDAGNSGRTRGNNGKHVVDERKNNDERTFSRIRDKTAVIESGCDCGSTVDVKCVENNSDNYERVLKKPEVCRQSSEHIADNVKVVDTRHLGRESQTFEQIVTNGIASRSKSLLSEQLSDLDTNYIEGGIAATHDSGFYETGDPGADDSSNAPMNNTEQSRDKDHQNPAIIDEPHKVANSVISDARPTDSSPGVDPANYLNERSDSMFDEYFDGAVETMTIDDVPLKDRVVQHPALDRVIPHPALDRVVPHPALDRVVPHPACHSSQTPVECTTCAVNLNRCRCAKRSVSQQDNLDRRRPSSNRSRSSTPSDGPHRRHISGTPSIDSDLIDPLHNCTEIYLPQLDQASTTSHRVQAFDQNLGRSLMAGFSDHYLSDFVLHGTSDPNVHVKVSADLSASVQQSVLDETVSEAMAVVADTDKWLVNVVSSRVSTDASAPTSCSWVASSLVCNLLESVHNLWKLKMSPEFCVMHLEDRLQEIYYKSRIFVEYIQSNRSPDLHHLCSMLKLDASDLPLLLAISTTHAYPPQQKSSRSSTESDPLDN